MTSETCGPVRRPSLFLTSFNRGRGAWAGPPWIRYCIRTDFQRVFRSLALFTWKHFRKLIFYGILIQNGIVLLNGCGFILCLYGNLIFLLCLDNVSTVNCIDLA